MVATNGSAAHEHSGAVRHEVSDVDARAVWLFGGGLTLLSIVIHLVVWLLYDYFVDRQKPQLGLPTRPSVERALPVKPQLQVAPESELSQLRASEEEILFSYGWVDRDRGIVRIPIDRAIDILARDGLPARSASKENNRNLSGRKNGK